MAAFIRMHRVARLGWTAFGVLVCSTALADPQPVRNIPTPEAKSGTATAQTGTPEAPAAELPLPYAVWQGTPLDLPTPRLRADLPPPLARPRQLPRRPFELSAALAAFLPSCGAGSLDARGCLTLSPGSGIEAALLYRVGPFFAVGAEAALSGFATRSAGAFSGAGGAGRFFGVVGRVYFADDGAWDPYLALTLGGGALTLRGPADQEQVSTTGFGGRIAGGIDYVFGSHFRLGPTASFAHWLSWSEKTCNAGVCRDGAVYGRVVGFATLGFRLTAAWGDVL